MRKTAVYALGGNALQSPTGDGSEASHVLAKVMSDVIDLLEMDWSVVITHGNGPQLVTSSPWTRNKHTSLTLGSQQLKG